PRGDGKFKPRSFLLNVGGGGFYCVPPGRPVVAAIRNCGGDPVAALFHRRVWKSDDDNDRIAAGAIYLDFHLVGVHAVNRGGVNFCQHVAAELQKIAAPKSAKYPSKVRCNGCLKVLSNIKGRVGELRMYWPVKPLQKRLNDRHPTGVTDSNI